MLEKLFSPASVAIVGASNTPGKVGHDVLKNLLDMGFPGEIYPVNPKAEEILGIKAWPNIESLPNAPELVVIAIRAQFVPSVVESCGKKGSKIVVVLSAGFREVGGEGAKLERELLDIASKYGIRIVGPNCLGVMDTGSKLNATFAASVPPPGSIGFFSQSGALCLAVLEWAAGTKVGLSRFVSLGNKADISETEMLLSMEHHSDTKVILGYLEGVSNGRVLMETAKKVTKTKPVVVLKSGSTAAGARAASSHTGSLAGSSQAFSAACRQSGIIRAVNTRQFLNLALALAFQPVPKGGNIAIITNSGGPGILAADACDKLNLNIPTLSQDTISALREVLPPMASYYNPIDVLGDAKASRYGQVLEIILRDPIVNAVIILGTPTAMLDVSEAAREIVQISKKTDLTIVTCFMGEEKVKEGRRILMDGGVPTYETPEEAAEVLKFMWNHRLWLEKEEQPVVEVKRDIERVKKVIANAQGEKHKLISPEDVTAILESYGIRQPKTEIARSIDECIEKAEAIGYPVVMKVLAMDITHKSDLGGVKVGLKTPDEVRQAFNEITSRVIRIKPEAQLVGVQIQEMITDAREVIVGFTRDPQFGPLIMCGLGGIFVEVLKDVAFRIAPVTRQDIRKMLREIRAFPVLQGIRGQSPADLEALEDTVAAISQLALDFPEIMEGEINPLMVKPVGQGVVAVDARFILRGES